MDEAWFWHTSSWLEYTLHYRPEMEPQSLSFMVLNDNQIVGLCPLIIETQQESGRKIREFSFGNGPCPAPAVASQHSEKMRKKILTIICGEMDALAARNNVQRAIFRSSPPAPAYRAGSEQPHPLQRFGFLDISLATQIVDLSRNEDNLLSDMQPGHRYHVRRSEKLLCTEVFDASNISPEIFDGYRTLHHRAAGRVTRPLITFEMMHRWIREGTAILARASAKEAMGYALFTVYKGGAYYSSSCVHPDAGPLPVGHALQWAAMRWMKQHGIYSYEIGIQLCGLAPHALWSEKEENIAMFKREFGGRTVAFWIGEKFYNGQYCRSVLKARLDAYLSRAFSDSTLVGEVNNGKKEL
jgi:hypothetical protein